jgi:hypothetical protein
MCKVKGSYLIGPLYTQTTQRLIQAELPDSVSELYIKLKSYEPLTQCTKYAFKKLAMNHYTPPKIICGIVYGCAERLDGYSAQDYMEQTYYLETLHKFIHKLNQLRQNYCRQLENQEMCPF